MKSASNFLPTAPPAALICSIARLIALTCVSLRPASGPLSISSAPILIVSSAWAAPSSASAAPAIAPIRPVFECFRSCFLSLPCLDFRAPSAPDICGSPRSRVGPAPTICPFDRMTKRSVARLTRLRCCSTTSTPVPARRISLMAPTSSSTRTGERPSEGSSSRRSPGLAIRARPRASICCWPPLSIVPALRARSSSTGKRS